LRIESSLPSYDANYLADYQGRVALETAIVDIKSKTPFDRTEFRLWASSEPSVLIVECRFRSSEPVGRTISLERWGTRLAAHYYEQIVDDPSVRLGGTSSGILSCDGASGAWVGQDFGNRGFRTVATVEGPGIEVERLHTHGVRWLLPASKDQSCIIRITVVPGSPGDGLVDAGRKILEAAGSDPGGLENRHRARWVDFWDRSLVHLADDYLENIYYLHFYTLFSCGLGDLPPMFTGAGWLWNGDLRNWVHVYHWNQQQLYWGLHSAARPELAENYLDYRWNQLPKAMADGAALFGSQGAWFSDIATLTGTQAVEPDTRRNLTVGAQISLLFYAHGRYRRGLDPRDRFLVDRTVPFVRACARLYQDLLVLGDDGTLRIRGGTSPYESYLNLSESLTDHAAIRALCIILDNLDTMLGTKSDGDLRSLVDRMPPWPVADGLFSPGVTHGGHPLKFAEGKYPDSPFPATLLAPVFPFACIGPDDRETQEHGLAVATLRQFLDTDILVHGSLGCSGHTPAIQAAARMGLADDVWSTLKLFVKRYQHFPNGLMHYSAIDDEHGMSATRFHVRMLDGRDTDTDYAQVHEKAIGNRRNLLASRFVNCYYETSSNIVSGIHEALLQAERGVIRVFPGVPVSVDAAFRLRTPDAVEVMAEQRGGEIAWTAFRSPATEGLITIRFESPWARGTVVRLIRNGRGEGSVSTDERGQYSIEVPAGVLVTLVPAHVCLEQAYEADWYKGPNESPKVNGPVRLGLERDF
jgi:hypothetical protein